MTRMDYGYVKVAAAVPQVQVADCFYNIEQIERLMRRAADKGVQVLVFPELCITGYTCQDLFLQDTLLSNAEEALLQLVHETEDLPVLTFVGLPLRAANQLFNAAVAIQSGEIIGVVPKMYLPNYREYQEQRWFTSSERQLEDLVYIGEDPYPMHRQFIFNAERVAVAVDICEDLWMPIPPSTSMAMAGADIIVNLSASNETIGKQAYRRQLVAQQSGRCLCGYVYASSGFGESTTDLVYAGSAMIAENGVMLAESERFSLEEQLVIADIDVEYLRHDRLMKNQFSYQPKEKDTDLNIHLPFDVPEYRREEANRLARVIDPHPFVPSGSALRERCEEIFQIQTCGLAKRLKHTHAKTAVVGISGGLDSTLALLVTVRAFDLLQIPRERIIGITMPGFGTTDRTYQNAVGLIRSLGVTLREISIREACLQHFQDIHHNPEVHDVTYENSQARERTQILMDVANQEGGLVIGTGDLSELALGWATYNGDHMSMYAVNCSIPKTLVKYLVEWVARHQMDEETRRILLDIIDTPISPELIPADEQGNIQQKTEDLVGPYELHDFFLYHFLRYGARPAKIYYLACQAFRKQYDEKTIKRWLRTFFVRFFQQQFKRSCLPDGPKVGSVSLSPRGDWRMPSDASAALWLSEIDLLLE